ncbi:jg12460 [Pararge aegeria aegeria]|uniref:Jg12460 protein n=1 Tax=Pararge aegeria aegeria TaxID=348720 RepID=A0A8S4RQ41_9NEOP|nr:jg12460 [Pararge aegeria aegeria]
MFCSKELKLLYATVVLLLEAELLVNTGAMESKRSSILVTQNADDLKSLELCTTRNQQRLGSVFGNFTRHHKKGHRRRTTTTTSSTQTTITYTTTDSNEDSTESYTTSAYNLSTSTTYPKLPKPLRLSSLSLDKDFDDNVHNNINNVIETVREISHERHHNKHHERLQDKEIITELDETSISKSLNKVKKLYRDSSASAVNKLSGKAKNGIFLTDNCTTVIAQIGTTAILHCEVSDITENTDWALHIRFATSADAGYYECQVPTHPPTSIFFKLVLVAAYAEIMGESEKIIHEGSMLKLVCVVKRSTEPPSYVFWYFENRMINYDLNGVSVHNGRQTSELIIGKAEPRHAGNYTCVPANAKAASVTVHVVQSETPAAMQHGNNSSVETQVHLAHSLILLSLFALFQRNVRGPG